MTLTLLTTPTHVFAGPKEKLYNAAFQQDWSRYPTPHAIILKLKRDFPSVYSGYIDGDCTALSNSNRALIGDSNASTGRPTVDQPNSSFNIWYLGCLTKYINAQFNYSSFNSKDDLNNFYGEDIVQSIVSSARHTPDLLNDVGTLSYVIGGSLWSNLTTDQQKSIVTNWIEKLIGPEEILVDLNIASSMDVLVERVTTELNKQNEQPTSTYSFLVGLPRETNQLQLNDAIGMTQFLLNLLDTLKY